MYSFTIGLINASQQTPAAAGGTREDKQIQSDDGHFSLGPCTWVVNKNCPDDNIRFYLFTNKNSKDRQLIHVDSTWETSNISSSYFDPAHPVKVIIHGYNSDMFLTPLIEMKEGLSRMRKSFQI